MLLFRKFLIFLELRGKLNIVFHTSKASLSASMLEYLGVFGSDIIFLPSSIAAAVISFGISSFNSKGMPCSRMAVLKKMFTAVVMLRPSSLKISSALSFTSYKL